VRRIKYLKRMCLNNKVKLVFMPGMDGTGISFEPLSRFLPENILTTIIRYPADRLLSFEETVECAHDQIKEDQDIVVAESFSGPVAIALIGSGKIRTKGLILCATFAKAPRRVLLKMLRWLPLEYGFSLPMQDVLLRYILGNKSDKNSLFPLWERVRGMVPAKTMAHRMRLLPFIDVCHFLPKLTMPCRYIQASEDNLIPASTVHVFTKAISHLVVRKVPGPHFILQSQPEASADVIKELINIITG
jgi:pimeloyl-[acyl-carrier protein] methyl ester esterase